MSPNDMPPLGLGTWQITGRDCVDAVRDALDLGYRHIDTARAYENEAEVGEGIARSGVPRGEIWVTTKLWRDGLRADEVRRQLEGSLRAMATDYVDLLLIHWPNEAVPLAETLGACSSACATSSVGNFLTPIERTFPASRRATISPSESATRTSAEGQWMSSRST